MKKNIFLAILSFSVILLSSCMSSKTDSKRVAMKENKSKFDKKMRHDTWFTVCAAEGGMMEVKLGELAQSNSVTENVKEFGRKMITDHSRVNEELKRIAASKKISLPDRLSDHSQKEYEWLSKKTGKDFDKAYMKFMVRDHKMDIHEFEREGKKGNDPEIKKFASDKIPVLKDHSAMAKKICDELKDKK
jgi:putative membrane protein